MRSFARNSLADQIATAIEERGLSAYAVGRLAGLDPGMVKRWMTGRRDLRLESAGRITAALGLRLTASAPRTRRADAARPGTPRADGARREAAAPCGDASAT